MITAPVRILHVGPPLAEDRVMHAVRMLSAIEFHVDFAQSIAEAAAALQSEPADIVLLDFALAEFPGLDGYLHLTNECEHVPVVILANFDTDAMAVEAMRRGAQDYLFKETLTVQNLVHSLRQALERWRFVLTLKRQATFDELTGLRNRSGFMRLADYRFRLARRSKASLSLLFIDIDQLKYVNDTFGHREGDRLIKDVAHILQDTLRESDILGRIGGDEFCAVLGEDNNSSSDLVVRRIQRAVNVFNAQHNHDYLLGLSIGVDHCDFKENTGILSVEDVMQRADAAMYERKRAVM